MKKLLLLLTSVCFVFTIYSQTYDFQDRENDLEITYRGNAVNIFKSDLVTCIKDTINGRIQIVKTSSTNPNLTSGIMSIRLTQTSYTSIDSLHTFIKNSLSKTYHKTYNYTAGNLDTAYYKIDNIIWFKKAYTYSGSNVTNDSTIYVDH